VSVALLIITDGRDDYLQQCVASADSQLAGDIVERWMFDDTGDPTYRGGLARRYPQFRHIDGGFRQGCAGAIQAAWRILRERSNARFVFHLEQDFVFTHPTNVDQLMGFLDDHPEYAQVALRRQPCNPLEEAAGGVVEQHPDWYTDHCDTKGRAWLEHSAYWTCNPCLYRTDLLTMGWPGHIDGRYSEDTFTETLRRDGTPQISGERVRFAYWGARDSGVWVRHIGHRRHQQSKDY
jgi:hypothetical protein